MCMGVETGEAGSCVLLNLGMQTIRLAEEAAEVGGLFNVVTDVYAGVVVDAGADCAGQSLVDAVYITRELPHQSRVRFSQKLLHVALICEAKGRADVFVQAGVDLPHKGEVDIGQRSQAQQLRRNANGV